MQKVKNRADTGIMLKKLKSGQSKTLKGSNDGCVARRPFLKTKNQTCLSASDDVQKLLMEKGKPDDHALPSAMHPAHIQFDQWYNKLALEAGMRDVAGARHHNDQLQRRRPLDHPHGHRVQGVLRRVLEANDADWAAGGRAGSIELQEEGEGDWTGDGCADLPRPPDEPRRRQPIRRHLPERADAAASRRLAAARRAATTGYCRPAADAAPK
ncbi:hypothetical protein T492DRAFT_837047 [Pavlovales sp. CCMP2436]|nr:hypothetical protein T492DRAFT_837047 [Pavlovales sp. CCMP2436]